MGLWRWLLLVVSALQVCLGVFPALVCWRRPVTSGEAVASVFSNAAIFVVLCIAGLLVSIVPRLGRRVGITAVVIQGVLAAMCGFWMFVIAIGLLESGRSPPLGLGTTLIQLAQGGAIVAFCLLSVVAIVQVTYRSR